MTSNMSEAASALADSAAASAPSILDVVPFVSWALSYIIVRPLHFLGVQAIPWTAISLYSLLKWLLTWLYVLIRVALTPVLLPLDLLVVRPASAVLSIIYHSRHLIYFVAFAVLLGSLMGLTSSFISNNLVSAPSSTRSTPLIEKPARPRKSPKSAEREPMADALYRAPRVTATVSSGTASEDDPQVTPFKGKQVSWTTGSRDLMKDGDRFGQAMTALADRRKRLGFQSR
ncbi:MAG: hypothetical protein CYPHOPRED_001354 [Cyphobasidiales sp. Tagirdzhanova-0007]|nr:MAG: hypothetical protein CYPHOPRED_001354 [Cyphobasidiales sp. Tagirdzhanova-0007]